MRHELKCWPVYFARLVDGTKTFEVRKDDRGYQAGDELLIREWDPPSATSNGRYTGRELSFRVGFVFHGGFDCGDLRGHAVLSLLPIVAVEAAASDTPAGPAQDEEGERE